MFVYINVPYRYNQETAKTEYIRVMKFVKEKKEGVHFMPPVVLEGKNPIRDLAMVLEKMAEADAVAFQKGFGSDPVSSMAFAVCNEFDKPIILEG